MYTHARTHTHTHTHTRTHTHTHAHTRTCTHTRTRTHIDTLTHSHDLMHISFALQPDIDRSKCHPLSCFLGTVCCPLTFGSTLLSSFFTVAQNQEAVILRYGRYERTIKEPGVSCQLATSCVPSRLCCFILTLSVSCRSFVYLLACLDACLFVYSFVCLVCLVCLFVCLFFAFTQTTQTPVPTSCSFDTEHCTGLHYSNVFGRTVRRVSKQMRSMDLPDERSGRRTVLDREGNPLVVSAVVIYQV